jgi:predicted dienelactone hydrolase
MELGERMMHRLLAVGAAIVMCLTLGGVAVVGQSPSASPTPSTASPSQWAAPAGFPLAEPGEYAVGFRAFETEDSDRGGREVVITMWYPAIAAPGKDPALPMRRAEPDPAGAPYPLILSSTKVAYMLAPHLASRGFVWASVEADSYDRMDEAMIDQPLDILFALDTVASRPPAGFESLIDAEHAGAIGYSFDGYNSLALSGARVDPAYYLAQCSTPDATTEAILSSLSAFSCDPAEAWDTFAAHAGEAITASEDGLWRPVTDGRIRAVMPLAAEGWWLFGDRGLAAVDRPTLMIVATDDALYAENIVIFEHLGTPDRSLISFLDRDHMMITDPAMVARMAHFAAAFFGHRLQGREDLARYYSEEFVAAHDELSWGAVPRD